MLSTSRDGLQQGIFARPRPGLPSHKTHNHLRTISLWPGEHRAYSQVAAFRAISFCSSVGPCHPTAFITSHYPISKRPEVPCYTPKIAWFFSGPHDLLESGRKGAGRSSCKLYFRLFGRGSYRKTNKSNCISSKQSKVRSAQASSSPYRPEVALHPASPLPAIHLDSIDPRPVPRSYTISYGSSRPWPP